MKVLSIRPPWVWAILHLRKDVENRSWITRYRGPLLLHAGKKITADDYNAVARHARRLKRVMPAPHELPTGGIVAMATLVDVVESHASAWKAKHSYGWLLEDVRLIPFVPAKGQLGLYSIKRIPRSLEDAFELRI